MHRDTHNQEKLSNKKIDNVYFISGSGLAPSGYHLCVHNETRTVSFLAMHKVPYTATTPCGGWLLWKTCTVTLYKMIHQTEYKIVMEQVIKCCDGYVQVGRYCALPVNRSGEVIAKPGSCPTTDGLYPGSEECELDMDCPGWQKCCQRLGRCFCSHPTNSTNDSDRSRLNTTVTVKTDYQQLMSKDKGLLNHTRLLQAMVTGALQMDDISVYYLSSWPVHPYRTATSLLITCNFTLSLYNVTSKLHLLLKHIEEVSSVTVEDVDECVEDSSLYQCSPYADCINTLGSYECTCRQGYVDVDPHNPGARCTVDVGVWTTDTPLAHLPPMNTTYDPTSNSTLHLSANSTASVFNSSEISMTTALSNTSSVSFNSSLWATSAPDTSMSSSVDLSLPTTTCSPSNITTLRLSNVTGTSFCVRWSSQFQKKQSYQVAVRKGSEDIQLWETSQTMMEVRGLQPGVLYNVTVTPCACGNQGDPLHITVKTDAQTLDATARLTNIQFTADLQNTSSQAYQNLSTNIIEEIYQSLSPEMKAMVDSGRVRIEIRSFSLGSVVVNFALIFTPNQSQDISNVSVALLNSLMNSSTYTVDRNKTSINDFDECVSGENDCSQWATCRNTWASYTCVCPEGLIDNDPERPGRSCQARSISVMTTPSVTTTIFSTVVTPTFTTVTNPTTTVTNPTMTNTNPTTTVTNPTTTVTNPTTTVTNPTMTNTNPTTTVTNPTTTVTNPTTTVTNPTMTITNPTTTVTNPTTTVTNPTTTVTNPTMTITNPTTTVTNPTMTITNPTTTVTNPTMTVTNPTMTVTIPAPTVINLTTPISNPTITDNNSQTTVINPTATIANHTTTITGILSTTLTPTNAVTYPTTTVTVVTTRTTHATALRTAVSVSVSGGISVQCRVASITVTVTKDFLLNNTIQESALYLGMKSCGINGSNDTHVQLTVPWNKCGTQLVHNDTYYTASVTLYNTMDSYTSPSGRAEVPQKRLEVPIVCTYANRMLISADVGSTGYNMIKDVIMGLGSFQVTVQLMNGTVPLPHNYSLSSEEVVVVEVSLNTSSEQIKVVINKCWATPTPNPADSYSYPFLENSCSLNTYAKVLMNGNSSTSRVAVQIFSLVNVNVIYLHCQVHICVQLGSDTCVPDCLQRTARSVNVVGSAFGSSGPLLRSDEVFLEDEYDTLHLVGFSCLGIGLTLFFIIALVCLFYCQRNRIGHYNFSVKPKEENFTYLVFNA
ncbi:uromodulin-like 1 [Echeneis naucrates]|uniref:uromodulin-like 1 n=1 Tax=Echeneis naucrates TaxID=173247 RepID=UPI00111343B8|nr:uromodulin-like 1 [Echeneis naucrates]